MLVLIHLKSELLTILYLKSTEQKIGGTFRTAQVHHSTVSFWDRD